MALAADKPRMPAPTTAMRTSLPLSDAMTERCINLCDERRDYKRWEIERKRLRRRRREKETQTEI
jgi:hypothetical protein